MMQNYVYGEELPMSHVFIDEKEKCYTCQKKLAQHDGIYGYFDKKKMKGRHPMCFSKNKKEEFVVFRIVSNSFNG